METMQKVLIVDDDAAVRETIGGVLSDEGFDISTAASGEEAQRRLSVETPDLVLVDVWMPDMDGIELLSRIRGAGSNMPVIVVSGHGSVELAVTATRLGAVDFIEKPFSIEGLLQSVNRALGKATTGTGSRSGVATADRRRVGETGLLVAERSVARSVTSSGLGLHSGQRTGIILHPLPPGSGIRFGSVAGEGVVEASVDNVDSTGYATSLFKDGTSVRTVEHLMAALHAYGVTNLLIKVEGEVPILDGSAVELCALLDNAGIEDQGSETPAVAVVDRVRLEPGPDQFIEARPYDGLRITYELAYPEPVGEQTYCFEFDGPGSFRSEIAPARTFGFVEEIRALEQAGLGQGGQLGNFILIGDSGFVNTKLRFPEELARHKILDLMGDLYLLGAPLKGQFHARKTGHSHNVELARAIRDSLLANGA